MEAATTAFTQDGIMFRSNHNRLSNLYPCIIDFDGETYNSVEQGFQHRKAKECNDERAATIIMSLQDPYTIMAEGKKIKDTPAWAKLAEQILYQLNVIKFHDEDFKAHLLSTGDRFLYEASFHPVWGVGMHLGQKNRCVQGNLKGANLHGKLLVTIRENIKKAAPPPPAQPQLAAAPTGTA